MNSISGYKRAVSSAILLCLLPLFTFCGKSDDIKEEEALESVQIAYDQAQLVAAKD